MWIVAHRCNDEDDISQALSEGANAIEFDVMSRFSGFVVQHHDSVNFHVPTIGEYLEAVMENEARIALLYVDYKGPDFSADACARLVGRMRAAGVPASGVKAVFSTASLDNREWFGGVPKESWIAPQVDEDNSPDSAEEFFRTFGFAHAWYGDGIAPVFNEPDRVEKNIKRAIQLRDEGAIIRGTVIWTINKMSSMRNYLKLGVNAILTDDPEDAVAVLKEPEFRTSHYVADKGDSLW
jgi:glycerophosphoryl diester phosphodiesterase